MALVQIADLSAAPFPLSGGELFEIDTKLESYKVKVNNLLSAYDHQDLDAISRQNAFVGLENVLQLSGGPFVQVLDSENIGSLTTQKARAAECIVFDNSNALIAWSDSSSLFSYAVVSGSGPENIGFVLTKSTLDTSTEKGRGSGTLLNNGYEAGFMIPITDGGVSVMKYYKINSLGQKILDGVVVFDNDTSESLASPYVKALPNGNLIVFFRDFDTSGGPLTFIITDDDGKILINKTVVTTDIPSFKGIANYNTTILPNGNIIVAWRSNDSTKLAKAAMYSQHGDLLIPETILFNTNRTASGDSVFKVMAFSNGNWLLSYINPSGQDVLYRIYDQTFNLIKNEQVAMDFSVNLGSGTIGKARTFNNQVVLIRNMTVGGPTASYMVFIDSKGSIRQTETNIWGSSLSSDNGENLNLQGNTLDGKLYITKLRDNGSDGIYLDIWTGSSPFQSGIHDITNSSATASITFDPPLPDSNYRLILELVNTVDSPPTVYSMVVESKSKTGFTVRLSGSVDSGNFELHWSAFSVKNTVISSGT